jgi:hypothetical protein
MSLTAAALLSSRNMLFIQQPSTMIAAVAHSKQSPSGSSAILL